MEEPWPTPFRLSNCTRGFRRQQPLAINPFSPRKGRLFARGLQSVRAPEMHQHISYRSEGGQVRSMPRSGTNGDRKASSNIHIFFIRSCSASAMMATMSVIRFAAVYSRDIGRRSYGTSGNRPIRKWLREVAGGRGATRTGEGRTFRLVQSRRILEEK
jgi:hypothetical protein